MALDVVIVQHAEKVRQPGDHGLTDLGREQATVCGQSLRDVPFDEIWCSTLRRSRETAELIADAIGVPRARIRADSRVVERINWWGDAGQTRDVFVADWKRSTADRTYQPRNGDSSLAAGARFAAFLASQHERLRDGRVLVVAHGGVTIDLVRTWFGDERVEAMATGLIEHGPPPCAVTRIVVDGTGRSLELLAAERLA
jgi:broad specificity phosphatase PhoE